MILEIPVRENGDFFSEPAAYLKRLKKRARKAKSPYLWRATKTNSIMAIDIMFAIMALIGFYIGFTRGIIGTVFTILSFVFGTIAGFKFAMPMTTFLKQSFGSDTPLMFAAGFLLSFAIVMILIRTAAKALEGILQTANINIINQMLGGMLTAFFSLLLYSFLLSFADQAHMVTRQTKQESMTYAYVKEFPAQAKTFYKFIEPLAKDFWDQSMDMMDQLEKMGVEETSEERVYDIEEE